MALPSAILRRGSRASQPAATAVAAGTIYQVTDEPFISEYSDGSAWQIWSPHRFVRKTADESVTSSTTIQDDDHLLFAIRASEVWQFELSLQVTGAAAGDFRFQVVGPTSYTVRYGYHALATAAASVEGDLRSQVSNESGGDLTVGMVAATYLVTVQGIMVNSTNAGNLKLQWAQGTSSGTATTVKVDSYLKGTRIS
jgi:hypothetical protein